MYQTFNQGHHWLAGLPPKLRVIVAREGFEQSKGSLALRRHALERRDVGQDAFLQALLSPEDWAYQQQVAQSPPVALEVRRPLAD